MRIHRLLWMTFHRLINPLVDESRYRLSSMYVSLGTFVLMCSTTLASDLVIPISFDEFSVPVITVQLNGHAETLMLDTGSSEGLHLGPSLLKRMSGVRFTGEKQRSSDMAGNEHENARFIIDNLSINDQTFHNVSGVEFSPWGFTLDKDAKLPTSPVVGLGLFEGKRLLIDYKAGLLTVFEDGRERDIGNRNKWVEVPFRRSSEGLLIDVFIEGVARTLALDSGATLSMIIADKIGDTLSAVPCQTIYPELVAQDCELIPVEARFGSAIHKFYAYLIPKDPGRFENAGLLGGDFLHQHAVYIDFQASRLFIRAYEDAE
ncbi:hypothetical protein CQ054_22465 [Ochrobactrum sp. MYb29]|uniref:retropepsin-like aspartic protease n=1 Tax=Brucella pituitosa TaxID=571256 RepID=UPI000C26E34D|nr:retropepsin-like aspartic protease [Brucella pituitosa]PJO49335.1 hypothetical protein CWE02_06055 [Brucella pituitosa]PRA78229.1 hypothetical protein CQ054_22465 [Ochrobactrum sp. MYb29]TCQ70697.1 aspartyl protease [Ochrobactrum sp. BH3]